MDAVDAVEDLHGIELFASQMPWLLKASACAVGAVALRTFATFAYGLLSGNNTGEVRFFLATNDDDDDIETKGADVTDAPRGRRAAAVATATAGATTTKLAEGLFAGHRASAGLRPVAGAWQAQRFRDAWPSADGAHEGDRANGDGPTDEPASLQDLLLWLKDYVVSDVEGTWASLHGFMVFILSWVTAALDLAFEPLLAMWMRLEGSVSGVPSHHVLVVLYVAFRAFLRVFRAVRPVVFITPSELRAIVATAREEGALSAEERLRKEFRRELDARDRESEAVANPQSAASPRRAKKVHRAGRKHRRRAAKPGDDPGGGGGEKTAVGM